jgi:hypothetical protein
MLKLSNGPITLTRDELKTVLINVRGAKPVTITARTKPDLVGGKKCPLVGLEKVAVVNGLINFSYENSVNKQREREAEDIEEVETFHAEPRRWGSRLFTENKRMLPLVHKVKHDNPYLTFNDLQALPADELLLELKVQKSLGHQYLLNGEVIPNEEAEQYTRSSSAGRQGVEREVILRDYYLHNIEQVVMDGETFVLGSELTIPQFFATHSKKGDPIAV